jgi:hypothetical protein
MGLCKQNNIWYEGVWSDTSIHSNKQHNIPKIIITLPLHLATFSDNKQHEAIKNAATSLMKLQSTDDLDSELVIMVEARKFWCNNTKCAKGTSERAEHTNSIN